MQRGDRGDYGPDRRLADRRPGEYPRGGPYHGGAGGSFRRDGPPPFGGRRDGPPFNGPGPAAGPIDTFVIDREKTCPLLIRVFCKPGSHHKLEEFAIRGKEPGSDAEIQVWHGCSSVGVIHVCKCCSNQSL